MLIDELKSIVGPSGWTSDPDELLPHLTEWRDVYHGETLLMVSPGNTEQVAALIRACAAGNTAVVPQGGNTGLCGGAIPDESGQQVLLSLSRMNAIRSVSPNDFSMIVEAGCILADAQAAARQAERLFPLSLAAEGTCQIGGNLSTNAGGINVLRYGNARDQVLGLEVVLADGTIWNGLRRLRKDTAGYDIKHLFIGSEGTLGVITAANLRLYPEVRESQTAMIAVNSPQHAVDLLVELRGSLADQLQAFELIPSRAIRYLRRHMSALRMPFTDDYPWYVLLESSLGDDAQTLESALAAALEKRLGVDAVVAKNVSEQEGLWRIRHSISEVQKFEGVSLKHDVSVPLGKIGAFIEAAEAAVLKLMPDARIVAFGHIGDGNVHFNISQPKSWEGDRFREKAASLSNVVYEIVSSLQGSISAEHGIGQLKRELLKQYRGEEEIAVMKSIKAALDPGNILNPGKVL
ncbi:MAG: FAD-binding oxidoreductase [Proteobacteria bacterium]|nr:FAD-binding oxidoreductase [Pseudomonadota bacterium]